LVIQGSHGFRPGYPCESQVISVCQDIANSLDDGGRIDTIIIDFSKAFVLIPHDGLHTKIAASRVDLRVVVWIREFLLGPTHTVKSRRAVIRGSQSNVRRPEGCVLGPLLFLAYENDI
jgi:hypothetical protein